MTWQKKPIAAPISDALVSTVEAVDSVVSAVQPILTVAETALELAKVFTQTTLDPAAALFDSIISELENLINDTFGSGVFILEVNPFNVQAIPAIVPGATKGPSPIIARYDDFGIPLMTPDECIKLMISSFDDAGDPNRPQFSNHASTVAFGFLVTAPDIAGFLALLDALFAVFAWNGFDLLKKRIQRHTTTITDPSVYPDWNSYRLNSINQLKDLQDSLLELLNTLKGYRDILNNIEDLIDNIKQKVDQLQQILNQFRDKLNSLKNAAKATGVYVFDFPLQTGGNAAVKNALTDPYLQSICTIDNGYTAALLFLGGGPSAAPVNAIKQLVI